MNPKVWLHTFISLFSSITLTFVLVSCGGSSSPPPPPVIVSISPTSANVVTNGTQQFTATVSGTSNTALSWNVNGVTGGNSTLGTISNSGLYTAPAAIPSSAIISVVAVAQVDTTKSGIAKVTVVKPPINQQTEAFPIALGTSGGNANDFNVQGNTITCCSGTLGSLVVRGGSQFILSNNHVLARSDQAVAGEAISQPGLIDSGCKPGNTVANFTQAAPLKTAPGNVDAAIAAVVPGTVDPSGAILELGSPNGQAAPPASPPVPASIGMPVAKSGRSTALTCSSIQSINTTILIDYQKGCGTGTTFTITYNNQVVVNGGTFSAAGDSGSLIINSLTAQPVALLYGGNTTNTVGNPIQDVFAALKDPVTGATPSIVSVLQQHAISCPAASTAQANSVAIPEADVARATVAKNQHELAIMADPAVIGVGVGESEDDPAEAAMIIYVDKQKVHAPIPPLIGNIRTRVVVADRFHSTTETRSNGQMIVTQAETALSDFEIAHAMATKEKHVRELMSDTGIIGLGVGRSADDDASAALVIYVDKSKTPPQLRAQVDGVRTKIIRTDRFRSFAWGKANACPRSLPASRLP
ncbi:MAG: hypothetical protein NVS1B11_19810 [Terriglobales bacterium]